MMIVCEKVESATWKAHFANHKHPPGYGRTPCEAVGDLVLRNVRTFNLSVLFPADRKMTAKVSEQSADIEVWKNKI